MCVGVLLVEHDRGQRVQGTAIGSSSRKMQGI